MGCCCSRQVQPRQALGLQEGSCYSRDSRNGSQVTVSAAGWVSTVPLLDLAVYDNVGETVFAAIFTWSGAPDGALYGVQNVVETFKKKKAGSTAVEASLRQTLHQLQKDFLSSEASEKVKSMCQFCAILAYIDVKQQAMFCASNSKSNAAWGQIVHGLAAQSTQAHFALKPSPYLNVGEAVESPQGNQQEGAAAKEQQQERLEEAVQTFSAPLTAVHETLIIGTAGFWSLLSADDAVLRSHFLTKATSIAAKAPDETASSTPSANTAAHLIQYAQGKKANYRFFDRRKLNQEAIAVVVTLRWPASSINQAFPSRGANFLEMLSQQVSVEMPASSPAKLRWRKVRMLLVEFTRARRLALRMMWLDLVSAAVSAGKARAREIEKLYWSQHQAVVRVTASGVITDSNGKRFLPTSLIANGSN